MAIRSSKQRANRPTLKRSFTAVAKSNPPSPDSANTPTLLKVPTLTSRLRADQPMSFFPKRRQSSDYQLPDMPIAAGPQAYQTHFPSFMSVYGLDSVESESASTDRGLAYNANDVVTTKKGYERTEDEPNSNLEIFRKRDDVFPPHIQVVAADTGLRDIGLRTFTTTTEACPPQRLPEISQPHTHQHRESTSTQASESTDSSPTTTISTADSSSLTDPSPSSSPESPVTILPLSSFSSTRFIHSLDDLTMSDPSDRKVITYDRPMTSPSPRKPRNAKGLALNLGSLADLSQQTVELDGSLQRLSAPASPSFVKPPLPKPRRKPSTLSLQTSANGPNPLARLVAEPPPTPFLRHAASSPQMMFSPDPRGATAPKGGMQLPQFERSRISGLSTVFRKPSTLKETNSVGAADTIDEEESPIRTQMATRSNADIRGDIFDAPASQEDAKSPGYPNGPVAIYEPHVYLYLEPTAEEASKFDVIMNVASEVKNPFKASGTSVDQKASAPTLNSEPAVFTTQDSTIPDTASSDETFKTTFECSPSESQDHSTESTPTTPKPTFTKQPEYIHIPWEHNTDISKDLMDLCETIDSRTKDGKKVLVHCQQGASRSASLIIAYGIYTNPSLSVNDAYVAAQSRSKWISPNMKLMYALQDFKKEIDRKHQSGVSGLKTAKHRMTVSADRIDYSPPREPLTAPLPSEKRESGHDSPTTTQSRARAGSTPNFVDLSPGPSSAPSTFNFTPQPEKTSSFPGLWSKSPTRALPTPPSTSGFAAHRSEHQSSGRKPNGPLFMGIGNQSLTGADNIPQTPSLWSPRIQEMTGTTGSAMHHSFGFTDITNDDVPATPSIMSPRATEFSTNPFVHFGFVSAQDTAPMFGTGSALVREDPRSPATKGEAPIIRAIDEML